MTWASAVAAGTGSSGSQEPPSLSPRLPQPTAPGLSTTVDRPPLLPPSSLPKRGERSFTSFRRGANGPKPQLRRHGGGERSPRMRSFAIVHIVRDRSQAGGHRPRPFARTRRNPSSAPTANDVNDVNDLSRTLRTPVCESRRPSLSTPVGGARDDGWNRPARCTRGAECAARWRPGCFSSLAELQDRFRGGWSRAGSGFPGHRAAGPLASAPVATPRAPLGTPERPYRRETGSSERVLQAFHAHGEAAPSPAELADASGNCPGGPATKLFGALREARPEDGMEPGVRPHGRVSQNASRDGVAELSFCPQCPRAATGTLRPMPEASPRLRAPAGGNRRRLPASLRPLPAASEDLSAWLPAATGRPR